MIKVMFVCLGNICRSPMAEFVLKDLVKKRGLEKEFYIESSATSPEELGCDVHYGTVNKLNSLGIKVEHRESKLLRKDDYENFDYILGMEERNIDNILGIVGEDTENKGANIQQKKQRAFIHDESGHPFQKTGRLFFFHTVPPTFAQAVLSQDSSFFHYNKEILLSQ